MPSSAPDRRTDEHEPQNEQSEHDSSQGRSWLHVDAPTSSKTACFLSHALGQDWFKSLELDTMPGPQIDAFADKDIGPKLFVQAASETCRQIHAVLPRAV